MMQQKTTLAWLLMIAFAVAWPFVVVFIVQPRIANRNAVRPQASASDLQLLLNVRRYEVVIPEDKNNWVLGLTGIVDGKEHQSGGGTVAASSRVVLLIQPPMIRVPFRVRQVATATSIGLSGPWG